MSGRGGMPAAVAPTAARVRPHAARAEWRAIAPLGAQQPGEGS